MKFVKTTKDAPIVDLLYILGGLLVLALCLGLPGGIIYMATTASDRKGRREAPLESYEHVAKMYEELPELHDEINQCKEDGVLTNKEVETLDERALRVRKDRELEKIK